MRGTEFRDILNSFLEENLPEQATFPSEIPSQTVEIPFVLLNPRLSPPRRTSTYKSAGPVEKTPQVEIRTQVISLSAEGRAALQKFLRLGAQEIENSLSRESAKAAYRRLLLFYHPDHHPSTLGETERKRMTEQFLELRQAYLILSAELK